MSSGRFGRVTVLRLVETLPDDGERDGADGGNGVEGGNGEKTADAEGEPVAEGDRSHGLTVSRSAVTTRDRDRLQQRASRRKPLTCDDGSALPGWSLSVTPQPRAYN